MWSRIYWFNGAGMGISENYIPQAENLGYLSEVIEELRLASQESTEAKNRILNTVDSIIRKLNGESKECDHTDMILQVNNFLLEHRGDDSECSGTTQIETLRQQNSQLKQLLGSKKLYNEEAVKINSEYEDAITNMMTQIRNKKEVNDKHKFQTMRECHERIQEAQRSEFDAYSLLVRNEDIVHRLAISLEGFYETFDENRVNADSAQTLKMLLHWLKTRLEQHKP